MVSQYFVGVNVVAIAEGAINSANSIGRGDVLGGLTNAFNTANMASGGKLGSGLDSAVRDLDAPVLTSFNDVAKQLHPLTDNVVGAIKIDNAGVSAIGHQAWQLGVSYLATGLTRSTAGEQSPIHDLMNKLGVRSFKTEDLTRLQQQAKDAAIAAATSALKNQGPEVETAAKNLLRSPDLTSGLQQMLSGSWTDAPAWFQTSESFERNVVALINEIRKQVPEADVQTLGQALASKRQELLSKLAEAAGRPLAQLQEALNQGIATADTIVEALPPAPLPKEVRDILEKIRTNVSNAQTRLAVFTQPGALEGVVQPLVNIDDKGEFDKALDQTQGRLEQQLTEAESEITKTERNIQDLKLQLTETKWEAAKQDLRSRIAGYKTRGAANVQLAEAQTVRAVAISSLTAQLRVKIEQVGLKKVEAYIQAQENRVRSLEEQWKGAQMAVENAGLEEQMAGDRVARWNMTYRIWDQQEKQAAEQVKNFYLDLANATLAQAWQVFEAYYLVQHVCQDSEKPGGEDCLSWTPSYNTPDAADVKEALRSLLAETARWCQGLQNDILVLRSRNFKNIDKDLLRNTCKNVPLQVDPQVHVQPGPKLTKSDIERYLVRRNGELRFRVRPYVTTDETNRPCTPQSEPGNTLTLDCVWNVRSDEIQHRLVGAIFSIVPGRSPIDWETGQLSLDLYQDNDGWIRVSKNGQIEAVPLELACTRR